MMTDETRGFLVLAVANSLAVALAFPLGWRFGRRYERYKQAYDREKPQTEEQHQALLRRLDQS